MRYSDKLQPYILEINACPDFAQTGSRLSRIIDTLFENTLTVAALPFFSELSTEEAEAKVKGLVKCLDVQVRSW